MAEASIYSSNTVTSMTTTNRFNLIKQFIKEFDPNNFYQFNNTKNNLILIDLLEKEVIDFELNNPENFENDNGRYVNVSNWNYTDSDKLFFYDSFYEVISSAWNYLIIKINDVLFAKVERGRIYEWDDLK